MNWAALYKVKIFLCSNSNYNNYSFSQIIAKKCNTYKYYISLLFEENINMLKLDNNKLAGLKTFDDHLQEWYRDDNSHKHKEFEAKPKLGIMQNS